MTNEDMYSQLSRTRPSASARWDTATCDVLKLVSSCVMILTPVGS